MFLLIYKFGILVFYINGYKRGPGMGLNLVFNLLFVGCVCLLTIFRLSTNQQLSLVACVTFGWYSIYIFVVSVFFLIAV
jgi:hypothetical protein